MTEILTESFCERCGTRYTFESARPRVRLKSVKVLSRGLKNFVLSDDTSIDEAMAAARSEADREASAHQLDAFHKTFSFCMSCRQYTCPNCWNEAEARCLSCAPLAMPQVAAPAVDLRSFRDAVVVGQADSGNGTLEAPRGQDPAPSPGVEHELAAGLDQAPAQEPDQADAEAPASDGHVTEAHVGEAPIAAEELLVPDELATQPEAADAVAVEAGTQDVVADEPEIAAEAATDRLVVAADGTVDTGRPGDKAVSQTLGLLRRFRPGQSLDAELAAFERERADAGRSDLPEAPVEQDLAAPTHPAETEGPRLDAAQLEGPGDSEPRSSVETGASPAPAAAPPADVVEQPTWRITAPEPAEAPVTPPADPRGSVPLQANAAPARPATSEPQWPTRPEWPTRSEWPAASGPAGLPFLGRPAAPQGGIEALWAASNQEIVAAPPVPGKTAGGIQPCISCGLSLSATARFCRRCGTLQGR